jgi:hypothetical protein
VSPRAREEIVRPRLQSGRVETDRCSSFLSCAAWASGRPLNFTVRSPEARGKHDEGRKASSFSDASPRTRNSCCSFVQRLAVRVRRGRCLGQRNGDPSASAASLETAAGPRTGRRAQTRHRSGRGQRCARGLSVPHPGRAPPRRLCRLRLRPSRRARTVRLRTDF